MRQVTEVEIATVGETNRMMKESFSEDVLFKLKRDREDCQAEGVFCYVSGFKYTYIFSSGYNFIFQFFFSMFVSNMT